MKKILVTATNYSKYCLEGKKILEDYGCEIVENPHDRPYTPEELKEVIADIDGVVAGVDTWNQEIFGLAPKLKAIARFGVGVDNIDLDAAKAHGITVSNCPGVNTSAVAEQAVGLILSLTRRIPFLNAAIRRGEWVRPMAHELKSQTVGFLGFGAIARNVAEKLQGFHPAMIAYDKYPNQEKADELGVRLCSLEEVLEQSDIISIHLPATPETAQLINRETIARMKDGVCLINTARGTIVDEKALCEALESGKIAGAGTDVFASEPVLPDNPLFAFEQYVATPHTSAETYENCATTSVVTAEALIAVFEGKEPVNRLV
ncbi:phosphoglycerate dehydrogenase [Diplocloster agilis]|uniref:Phosphoglycerate dehydrogenase n=1 Tax=Diplocloster agilis TaxID=2850323 RepID=A0A949JYQ8_9FIRM|nr:MULTISPECIES: phosphoglycerate dehydrogenase [Lachnospiraceae]MBU9735655.1 phosphoglycerate dehydrogenase [Diplocloster agilis]MBU9742994.1 phosphoglycerate dehydrogenase [Diplocloster agilis]MCU6732393.1 phosphoglycerate dehydrogenase [Suonthocola fibrivorans]SCI45451.1 D-3-phosphoglycerate dehydrogenase [uncultured Clostridium sp.]